MRYYIITKNYGTKGGRAKFQLVSKRFYKITKKVRQSDWLRGVFA